MGVPSWILLIAAAVLFLAWQTNTNTGRAAAKARAKAEDQQ